MTSKELWKKRIEYAVKNNDSTLESLAEKLELLEILKERLYFNFQCCINGKFYHNIAMRSISFTDDEYEKVKEWLEK